MKRIKNKLEQFLLKEPSPTKLALSVAVGTAIAFSPFLGVQTILVFIFSWILSLQTPIVLTISYIIGNPWTMIPIAVFNYIVGTWITDLLHFNVALYNPTWMNKFNIWLDSKIGAYLKNYVDVSQLSLWNYLLGGFITAAISGLVTYFIALKVFTRLLEKKSKS